MEYRSCSLEGVEGLSRMATKFWKNKNVFITGHEGFLGSNLTKQMLAYQANIVGLDIKINRKNTIFTKNEYKKINVIKGNVANYKLLKNIITKFKIDVVFHLAAEAIVGKAAKNPLGTFSTNIRGTWNLLEACRYSEGVKAIIIASSDKAYGRQQKLPYIECAPLQGDHPYDVSKSCADLVANAYFHTYDLPVAITRCGNIFGAGDFNFSRIVPDAIRCALRNKILLIRSNGKFVRDYVYIDDIINGYVFLAEKLQKLKLSGEAFNFSNEEPISVIELVKKIYRLVRQNPNYAILNQAKYEIRYQYLSSKKARRILGWKPKFDLEEGLNKTIEWYRHYLYHL